MSGEYFGDSSDCEAPIIGLDEHSARGRSRVKKLSLAGSATGLLLLAAASFGGRWWEGGGAAAVPASASARESQTIQHFEETDVIPAYEQCSESSENCISTKCCKVSGSTCFLKNTTYASCRDNCEPGKDGWCSELVNMLPVASYPGLRFFCFGFYTSDTGLTTPSYELSLLRTQLFLGASLFSCPRWVVYSDVETWLSPGPPMLMTTKVYDVDGDFHLFKSKAGTWINAMMYYQAWLDLRKNRLTTDSDWVIKVDADAVFLPERLIDVLQGYQVPAGGVYVENCKTANHSFSGNLEVVSAQAFHTFLENLDTCKETLDWKGKSPGWKWGPWKEDLFMQKCMDKIGVPKVSNITSTTDALCKADLPNRLQNGSDAEWQPDCKVTKTAAMHPYETPDEYFVCLAATQR
jgi:hypothetical protein